MIALTLTANSAWPRSAASVSYMAEIVVTIAVLRRREHEDARPAQAFTSCYPRMQASALKSWFTAPQAPRHRGRIPRHDGGINRGTEHHDGHCNSRGRRQGLPHPSKKQEEKARTPHRSSGSHPDGNRPERPSADTSLATPAVAPVPVKSTTSSAARPVTCCRGRAEPKQYVPAQQFATRRA